MANEIITTLHPENDEETNLYPNIKGENIPNSSVDEEKLSSGVRQKFDTIFERLDNLDDGSPHYVNTASNILALTENKGIAVATDTGYWYYWNGSQYVSSGKTYQSTGIGDGTITTEMLNNDCLIKYPYLNGANLDNITDLGRYIAISCTNTPVNNPFMLEVQRYKSASGNSPWLVQIAIDINTFRKYYRVKDNAWTSWYECLTDNVLLDYINNIIDDSKYEDNKFVNWTNGNIGDSDEYKLYNDYIEINGDTYIALFMENNGIYLDDNYAILGAYYDTSKNYLDEIYISSSESRGATFVKDIYKLNPPVNTKYFRFSIKKSYNYKVMVSGTINKYYKRGTIKESYLNKGGLLQDKIIVNFGDSVIGNNRDNTSISSYIAKNTGARVYNIGFGGCKMSKHTGNWDLCSMYNLAKDIKDNDFTELLTATSDGWSGMPSYFENTAKILSEIDFENVDLITISYGTNDYRDGANAIGNTINIFDNDFDESGFINPSTGEDASSSGYKRTSKYYPIKSVSNLYLILSELVPTLVLLFYDLDGNYLGYSSHNSGSLTYTFSVPNGAVCFRAYTEADFSAIACISYESSEVVIPYFNNEDVIDCLKYSIKAIQTAYPNIKILVTTPIYRSFIDSNNKVLTNSDVADFGGGTLIDYSNNIIKACEETKISCLDLYKESQLNKETKQYYYPTNDGTHPNDEGRKQIATLISNEIIKLIG